MPPARVPLARLASALAPLTAALGLLAPLAAVLGLLAPLTAALALLAPAPAAAASSSVASKNWSGYAVHRAGVRFRSVSGSWRVPSASCTAKDPAYSATWVGLGGYSLSSQALEQIGTETDCTAAGRVATSAWYELVPAPSRAARLTVHPGDAVTGSVSVRGRTVTLTLADRTSGRRFSRTLNVSPLDLSSAEWIEEAPSECTGQSDCQILPLADFGTVDFTGALAVDDRGRRGSVIDRAWGSTRITMSGAGRYYVSQGGGASAAPSPLADGGRAFQVTYLQGSASRPARRANVRLAADDGRAGDPGTGGRVQPGGARR
jgi:hypothetical protein